MIRPPPSSTLFPYTTLFRSWVRGPRTAGPLRRFNKRNWMPASSATRPIRPSSASISRTRCPLPNPPIAGLQDMTPIVSKRCVTSAVLAPARAAAEAASHPAWPPPITMTSKTVASVELIWFILMQLESVSERCLFDTNRLETEDQIGRRLDQISATSRLTDEGVSQSPWRDSTDVSRETIFRINRPVFHVNHFPMQN